jgi:hypothetical protein
MPLSNNDFNHLIGRLREYTRDLVATYHGKPNCDRTIKGNIGEKFVGYCIFHSLWSLGYPIDFNRQPHSYTLTPKFGADDVGSGGIDLKLDIVNLDTTDYTFLFEVKNWAAYRSVPPAMFTEEILDRFTRDGNHEYNWVVTMNERNIRFIRDRCLDNNVHILPIRHHITTDMLQDNTAMRAVFNEFIDNLTRKIRELAPQRTYPTLDRLDDGVSRTQCVMQDLFLGVPYDIMEHRYNVSRGYISRIASYIRSFHIPLPDRRSKDWRLIRELQE